MNPRNASKQITSKTDEEYCYVTVNSYSDLRKSLNVTALTLSNCIGIGGTLPSDTVDNKIYKDLKFN